MANGFNDLIAMLSNVATTKGDQALVLRLKKVRNYLLGLPGIRIFVANSNNFGHQASSVAILNRLIALGVEDGLELVVYASDGNFAALDAKLKLLIPNFPGSSNTEFKLNGVTVKAVRLIGTLATQGEFAITGGYDDTYHGGDTKFPELNVLNYVQLQPYGWIKGRNLFQTRKSGATKTYLFDKVAASSRIGDRAFYRPVPAITDWTAYHSAYAYDPAIDEAIAVARVIVNSTNAGAINQLPVYGIATLGMPAKNLYNIAAGMLSAMYGRPDGIAKRPSVLTNIQKVSADQWQSLADLISGAKGPKRGTDFDTWRRDNRVEQRFKLIGSPDSPATEKMITAAIAASRNSYDILIVYVGPLPTMVFDLLYATATMPPVLEGQSSLELMLNLGKPYLKMSRYDAATSFGYPARGKEAFKASAIAYDGIVSSYPASWNDTAVARERSVLQYPPVVLPPLFNAYWQQPQDRPQRDLESYFTKLGTHFHDEVNDKLLRALDIVVNRVGVSMPKMLRAMNAAPEPKDLLTPLYANLEQQWKQNKGEINLLTAIAPGFITDVLSAVVGKQFTIQANEPKQETDKVTVTGTTAVFETLFGAGETRVEFVFTQNSNPQGEATLALGFDANFDNVSWNLPGAAWLGMGQPHLGFSIDPYGDLPVQGRMGATISAGAVLDVGIVLPSEPDTFNFRAEFKDPYPGIDTLFQWIGGINIAAILPAQLQITRIVAKSLAMDYNYTDNSIGFISFLLGTPEDFSWTLVPAVDVTSLNILTTVTSPGDLKVRETTVDIDGKFLIETSEATIQAHLPKLRVNGGLVDGTEPLKVADIVGTYLGQSFQEALPGFISTVAITGMNFSVDQATSTYAFAMDVTTDWPIEIDGTTAFTVTGLGLSVDATSTDIDPATSKNGGTAIVVTDAAPASAASKKTEITGKFTGTTIILPDSAKVGVSVTAQYLGSDKGWTFDGHTTTVIKLGALLSEELGFDAGAQADYNIDLLSLKITTLTNSWVFKGEFTNWKIDFLDLTIDKASVEAGYNGTKKAVENGGAADLAHLPPRAAATPEMLRASAAQTAPAVVGDDKGYFSAIAVEMTWLGMRINPWIKFASEKKPTWGAVLPDFHLSAEAVYDETKKEWTGKFKFTENTTLGNLIETMVSWITGSKFGLEAPWSVLNDISLSNLELDYNFTTGKVVFKVNIGPINLGICTIDSIDVNYASGQADPKDNGVHITLSGSFPWNVGAEANGDTSSLGPWDASEPGAAPAPPGGGNKYFDLRLLALGQHVTVDGLTSKKNVAEVIESLENLVIPQPPDVPIGDGVNQPIFAPDSSWFIAFDFGVLKVEKGKEKGAEAKLLTKAGDDDPETYFISLAIVFNDPSLYALRISLDGPMAKIFAGLDFQIMYQQVSKNVGKYSAQIVLPDIMRKIQIGVASITLPTFAIEVYTNGDFQVDIGFPWQEDFSRSFSIEIQAGPLPLMGSAGFYFGKLSSATTDKVPITHKGWFNPVIVFGFGAQIGLGKSIEMGILKAGFSLTVFGIIEGVIARWLPYTTDTVEGAPNQLQDGYYFSLTGTLGVQGRLYGSINFAIISADLNVRIAIWIKATFASYEPIPILVQALVDVSLAVKINLGLFKITIHLGFKATVKASFILDNPMKGPAPWADDSLTASAAVMALSAPARLNARGLKKIAGSAPDMPMAMGATGEVYAPDWTRLTKGETLHLSGYVAPVLTVVGDADGDPASQPAAYAVNFFLKAQKPIQADSGALGAMASGNDAPAAEVVAPDLVARAAHARARALTANSAADALFEDLAIRTLQWIIAAGRPADISPSELNKLPVSDTYLTSVFKYLSDKTRPIPIPASAIDTFLGLQTEIDFKLEQDSNAEPATAVFFPAVPSVHLNVPAFAGGAEYDYEFGKVNSSTSGYIEQLRLYFDALKVQIDAQSNLAANAAVAPVPGGPSIAEFVYGDYFTMIGRLTVQALRDGLSNFKLPLEDVSGLSVKGIVDYINRQMQIDPEDKDRDAKLYTLGELMTANKKQPLNSAATLPIAIAGMSWQAAGGQSFDDIAKLPVFDGAIVAGDLAEHNKLDARIIASGIRVSGNGNDYTTQGADSLKSIADALKYATVEDLLTDVPALLANPKLLADQSILDIPAFGHKIAPSDTLESVAERYALEIGALETSANGAIVDLFLDTEHEPSLNVPHLAQYNLGDLIDEMVRTLGLQNAAGMVSRYYLHGLRLKTRFATGDILTPGDKVPLKKDADSYPDDLGLFALTGQTVPLPNIPDPAASPEGPYYALTLTSPDSWLKFNSTTTLTYTLNGEFQNSRYLQYKAVREASATYLSMGSSPITPLPVAEAKPARFPLANEIVWQTAVTIDLPMQTTQPATPRPRLWSLPNSLINLPNSQGMLPTFAPVIARTNEARGTTQDDPVNNYCFGSLISFNVKRIDSDATGATKRSYEIIGAPEAEVTLLERILDQLTDQTGGFDQVNLFYRPSATGSEAKGWQSDNPADALMGITQTNLSTDTHPEGSLNASDAVGTDRFGNLIGTPNRFLRLLWEASITRSGGFYLNYTTGIADDDLKGLPDHAFNDQGEAELAIFVVYQLRAETGLLFANFMNVAVTNEAFDLSDAALIAEAVPVTPPSSRLFEPGVDTLKSYADSYYMGVGVLADLNTTQTLADQAPVVIEGGMYQVPKVPPVTPDKANPGGDLGLIAQHFGTDIAAIQQVNPAGTGLPTTLAPLTSIKLPRITVTIGATDAGGTLADLSTYFSVPLAELAAANADVSLFTAVALNVRVGPLSLAPDIQQGVAGISLVRPEPVVVDTPTPDKAWGAAYLRQTFGLLGYRLADNPGNSFFHESDWGLPAGPVDPDPEAGGDKVQAANSSSPDGKWHFSLSVPYAQIVAGGDPNASPYLGVGELLQFDMAWLDLFGNRIQSEFRNPTPPASAPQNKAPQITGYTDRLLGIGQWPGVAAAYQIAGDGGTPVKPRLTMKLRFDDGTYMKAATAARSSDPDTAAAGRKTLDQAIRSYTVIQQQQNDPASISTTLTTTLIPNGAWPIPRTELPFADIKPDAPGDSYGLNQWAELILSYLNELSDTAKPVVEFDWTDYDRTVPLDGTLNDGQIFKLETSLTFARDSMRVAGGLRTSPGVAANASSIAAWTGPLGTETTREQRTLVSFARDFTDAFAGDPTQSQRIASGSDNNVYSGGAKPLWVATFGAANSKKAISYEITDKGAPTIFAPRPISNILKSKAQTRIIPYTTGAPLSKTTPAQVSSFVSIDLDRWMRTTLSDVDALLTPKYVTPANILSNNIQGVPLPEGRQSWPDALQSLLDAKEDLANALKGAMLAVYTDEHPSQKQNDAIRESFRQAMLAQVSQFYAVKAGLQFEADVHAAITPKDGAKLVPRIYGNILNDTSVQTLPNLTVSSPKLDLKFSGRPKLDEEPSPYLSSLVTTTTTNAAKVTLNLVYQGGYIEHEIGALPGITGYRPSTWLSFVDIGTEETPDPLPLTRGLGTFEVPIILRAYPEVPTLVTQDGLDDYVPQCPPQEADIIDATGVSARASAPATCPKPGDFNPVEAVTRWAYAFEYSMQDHAPQDEVHGTIAFNIKDNDPVMASDVAPRDLFENLAEFVHVYPKVLNDLNAYLLPIDVDTKDAEQLTNAQYALESATSLVKWVAETAAIEFAMKPAEDITASAAIDVAPVSFVISEAPVEVEEPDKSGTVIALEITLALTEALPPRVGTPEVKIAGYTCQRQPGSDPKTAKFLYLYTDPVTGKKRYLESKVGSKIAARRFILPEMEILERQDALTSVYLTRNAGIIDDHTIVDSFVYRTPDVSFESALHPTIFRNEPVNIALAGATDKNTPVKRSVACQLSVFYEMLFKNAGTREVTIQLGLYYAYSVNGQLNKVRLPVFLMPPTNAALPTDDEPPNAVDGGETIADIVTKQAATWQLWYDENKPILDGGQIEMDMTIMSDLTAKPMPVLRMTDLYLSVKDIEGL